MRNVHQVGSLSNVIDGNVSDVRFLCLQIKLETVFGLTVSSNAALDCDPNTEVVAYPAG